MNKGEFERDVKHYIKVHKSLHGSEWTWEDVVRDFMSSFPDEDAMNVLEEVERQEKQMTKDDKRYGLFIGRVQPFTNGHNAIIQKIIRNGKIPIIILGSIDKHNEKNPLSYEDRVKLIKKIYPFGVKFIGLPDKNNWDDWFKDVQEAIKNMGVVVSQVTLYAHNKEVDNKDFKCNGKVYKESSYTEIFKDVGYKIKQIDEVTCIEGEVIHASDVRNDEEAAKRNLDARIYRTLKDKFGWWE